MKIELLFYIYSEMLEKLENKVGLHALDPSCRNKHLLSGRDCKIIPVTILYMQL